MNELAGLVYHFISFNSRSFNMIIFVGLVGDVLVTAWTLNNWRMAVWHVFTKVISLGKTVLGTFNPKESTFKIKFSTVLFLPKP